MVLLTAAIFFDLVEIESTVPSSETQRRFVSCSDGNGSVPVFILYAKEPLDYQTARA